MAAVACCIDWQQDRKPHDEKKRAAAMRRERMIMAYSASSSRRVRATRSWLARVLSKLHWLTETKIRMQMTARRADFMERILPAA